MIFAYFIVPPGKALHFSPPSANICHALSHLRQRSAAGKRSVGTIQEELQFVTRMSPRGALKVRLLYPFLSCILYPIKLTVEDPSNVFQHPSPTDVHRSINIVGIWGSGSLLFTTSSISLLHCSRNYEQISFFLYDPISIHATLSSRFFLGQNDHENVMIYSDLINLHVPEHLHRY